MSIGQWFRSGRLASIAVSLVLVVVVVVVLVVSAMAADLRPTPAFLGPGFPQPPEQKQAWLPPKTGLPRFLITATETLADQGLGDPRGCEYREVEFLGEDQLQRPRNAKARPITHAWVLPAAAAAGQDSTRFAVAWNGLIYPLVKLGEPAKLDDDVPPLPVEAEKNQDQPTTRPGRRSYSEWGGWGATPHLMSASQEGVEPIRACLLLRLGRADLAERMFAASTTWKPPGLARDLTSYGVSYLTLANDWAWAMFERAVAAHARSDDRQALADARELARIKPLIEAKAKAMGFPETQGNRPGSSYLSFLGQLPALLGDQEGRAKQPGRKPADLDQVARIADQAARIAALIDDLDQSNGGDGFSQMGNGPTLKAIVHEGAAAVEPLLKALETDNRLTRSTMGDDRRGGRTRTIKPVFQIAYSALVQILETDLFSPISANGFYAFDADPKKRLELAAAIRAYSRRFAGVSEAEKWYQILSDDRASARQWVQAAAKLVEWTGPVSAPAPARRHRSSPYGFGMPRIRYGEKHPCLGDALRDKKTPSVAAIMVRRAELLAGSESDSSAMGSAEGIALGLASFEPQAARPLLADLARRCRDRVSGKIAERFGSQVATEAAIVARLTDARVQLGDPQALVDYADTITHLKPENLGHQIEAIFGPMEDFPTDPIIVKAAEAIFLDTRSRWLPWLGDAKNPNAWNDRDSLYGSPMMGVAAFRSMLVRTLSDNQPFGTARLDDQGSFTYKLPSGAGGGSTAYVDPDGIKATPDVPMRVCDFVAWKITTAVNGIPPLMPYWPLARRDQAIADQSSFLGQFGDRYTESPLRDAIPNPVSGLGRWEPVFPPLDHPATLDEVRRGLAIFSLEGQGPTRLVPWPRRPVAARAVQLKEFAYPQQSYDPATAKAETKILFDQEGLVWQVEEVEEAGRWQRYYGFVGRKLARVPAEEIEFPAPWFLFHPMTNQVDAQLLAIERRPGQYRVTLRNRGGLPRSLPTTYLDLDRLSLRPGIVLELDYTPTVLGPGMSKAIGAAQATWEQLPARSKARLDPGTASRVVEPSEAFDAFDLRVEDWFDVSRRGSYRLRVRFEAESGVAEGTTKETFFPIPEPPQPTSP